MSEIARDLEGKVAIVTGAVRGIGLATVKRLAAAGATVVAADLPDTPITESAKEAAQFGRVVGQPVDIADEESVNALVEYTLDNFGRLDILDNNAARQGLSGDADLLSMSPETWDSVFAVNTRGTMLMCKHAVRAMVQNGGGSIVNISSGTSLAGQLYQTAYACSKGAINTLSQYVATQYASQGVRCNTIAVGLVNTEKLQATLPQALQDMMVANKLSGRLGKPEDVAEMVAFLASDRSSWITGQLYCVDGGFFAHGPNLEGEKRLMAEAAGS